MSKEKVLVYGNGFMDVRKGKDATHNLASIYVDNFNRTVRLVIQKGVEVSPVTLSMERAQEIGFINLDVLDSYLK